MVRNSRKKTRKLSRKRITLKDGQQAGGPPAYRFHGNSGLLSGSSLEYSPIGLTTHQQGFSDHIVSTSGGGNRKKQNLRKKRRRSQRRRSQRRRSQRRRSQRRRSKIQRKKCN